MDDAPLAVTETVNPTSEGVVRTRVKAALTGIEPILAGAVENAIVVAVLPDAAPVAAVDLTGATMGTTPSVDPVTGQETTVSDGTATLSDGTVVPVSRDETHDSVDPATGALTDDAVAARAALLQTDGQKLAAAQADLDTLNAKIKEAEAAEAADEAALADLRTQAAAKQAELEAAQAALTADQGGSSDAVVVDTSASGAAGPAVADPVAGGTSADGAPVAADGSASMSGEAAQPGTDSVPAGADTAADVLS